VKVKAERTRRGGGHEKSSEHQGNHHWRRYYRNAFACADMVTSLPLALGDLCLAFAIAAACDQSCFLFYLRYAACALFAVT